MALCPGDLRGYRRHSLSQPVQQALFLGRVRLPFLDVGMPTRRTGIKGDLVAYACNGVTIYSGFTIRPPFRNSGAVDENRSVEESDLRDGRGERQVQPEAIQ